MWLELIRLRPALAADLLDYVCKGLVPSSAHARMEPTDLSAHKPVSYHADAVVTLGKDQPELAVIVEVQLRRDPQKHLTWPAYVATARARLGCPTVLLVISPKPGVAGWARKPIDLGHPGLVLRPLVLGPDEVPVLTDGQTVPAPELAVLSAAVHGPGPDGPKVFETLLDCMKTIDVDRAQGLMDEVLAVLPRAARALLEGMMKTEAGYKSDFARRYFHEGKTEGKAEGQADMVLAVLSARGIVVPDEARARIVECTDLEQLVEWGRRAATAQSIDDVFDQ
ncbi:hypothetical protein GCM10023196_085130 [Actinoallomurus vinaceus]|uniref:Transposase (putative) YhgA-like domain-containing protein n=2 Tax=Actinoallomurus vinaceus TaxID=1080074 RepID=A0ABP8UQM7_9ACTN